MTYYLLCLISKADVWNIFVWIAIYCSDIFFAIETTPNNDVFDVNWSWNQPWLFKLLKFNIRKYGNVINVDWCGSGDIDSFIDTGMCFFECWILIELCTEIFGDVLFNDLKTILHYKPQLN